MSQICVFVIKNGADFLRKSVADHMKKYGYGVFFDNIYKEPFLDDLSETDLIFSLADNGIYDNCEMLFLQDNCSFNGHHSPIPFLQRMKLIEDLILKIIKVGYLPEIFVGQSGTLTEEYAKVLLSPNEFVSFMKNADPEESYHILFKKELSALQIDQKEFKNSLESIVRSFEYDTIEFIDNVLTDDETDPQYSPNSALHRLQHLLIFKNHYYEKHYHDVGELLLSCGYCEEEIDTLLSLAQKEEYQGRKFEPSERWKDTP